MKIALCLITLTALLSVRGMAETIKFKNGEQLIGQWKQVQGGNLIFTSESLAARGESRFCWYTQARGNIQLEITRIGYTMRAWPWAIARRGDGRKRSGLRTTRWREV